MSELATSQSETVAHGLSPLRWSVRLPRWVLALGIACISLHFFAVFVRRAAAEEPWRSRFIEAGWFLFQDQHRFMAEAILIAMGLGASLIFGRAPAQHASWAFSNLAWRKREAIAFATLMPIALRLALFPIVPVPEPKVADEFGYLFVADTFAAGRVVNPPHPLWQHFETLYILQEPIRASIYPVATGILMALPKALGTDPWFGVLAAVGLMCGAICWMLQGWLSPQWALLGALLAGLHTGISTYWVNSYWGGSLAAAGGALVLGGLPRMLRRPAAGAGLWMATGLAILVQTRPFEGSLLFVTVCAVTAVQYVKRGPSWRRAFLRRALPALTAGGMLIFAGSGFYNWRVTGNPLLPPYLLHQQIYGTPQNLRFGQEVTDAPRAAIHQDIRENFEWQRETFHSQLTLPGLMEKLTVKLKSFWSFFVGPSLSLPLLLLGLFDRRVRYLAATLLFVVVGAGVLYPFFFPHYVAPVYGAMMGVAGRGLARLRSLRWRDRSYGRLWLRWVVGSTVISAATATLGWTMLVSATSLETTPRAIIEGQLRKKGGAHLVLVRYGQRHDFHQSWIYNDADLDSAPIVWARDLGKEANKPILRYYHEREVWLAEPDENPPLLTPYYDQDHPRITAVLNAAGKSNYFKAGVAPGSVLAITGRNLIRDSASTGFETAPQPILLVTPALMKSKYSILPGIRVEFNGERAAVLRGFRWQDQDVLAVVAPSGLRGSTVSISLESGDGETRLRVPVLAVNPGIFQTKHADGRISGALWHLDGTPVSPSRPARRGETVQMLTTGSGDDPVRGVVIGINHQGASYRGMRRGQPGRGMDLLSFEIPATAPSGSEVPLSMGVDSAEGRVYSNNSVIAIE